MTLKLPDAPKPAISTLDGASILIFGPDKCGKTSFVTQFPNHFMLECNPGNANHLNRNSVDIYTWEELISYLQLVANTPDYCKTIIIDEIHRMYTYCYRYVRQKLRMGDTEKDNFDVWRTVRNLFSATLDDIKKLEKTTILTCNEDVVTVTVGGKDVSMLDINLNNQGRDVLHGYCLMRARMDYIGDSGERELQLDGIKNVNIGHGFSNNFRFGGKRLTKINLGSSPESSYSNFLKAYNNELAGEQPKLKIRKN